MLTRAYQPAGPFRTLGLLLASARFTSQPRRTAAAQVETATLSRKEKPRAPRSHGWRAAPSGGSAGRACCSSTIRALSLTAGRERARAVAPEARLGRRAGAQGRLPHLAEGAVFTHRVARPIAAELDETEQRAEEPSGRWARCRIGQFQQHAIARRRLRQLAPRPDERCWREPGSRSPSRRPAAL